MQIIKQNFTVIEIITQSPKITLINYIIHHTILYYNIVTKLIFLSMQILYCNTRNLKIFEQTFILFIIIKKFIAKLIFKYMNFCMTILINKIY